MEHPCPRSAYMPVRGAPSNPTKEAAVTLSTPSLPGAPDLNPKSPTVGITEKDVPGDATTSCDGPRWGEMPLFTALTTLRQNVSPVPPMLSNSSGVNPGNVSVIRHVP